MPFWGWIVVGAVLLAAEMTVVDAQFYLVFVGVAALATGGVVWVAGPFAPAVDWALFGALCVLFLTAFRGRVYARIRRVDGEVSQGTVGEIAIAREVIAPGGRGRVELRGTLWDGHNRGDTPIAAGERARVVAMHGLALELRRES